MHPTLVFKYNRLNMLEISPALWKIDCFRMPSGQDNAGAEEQGEN
jgi:hypothetical protein